MKTTAAEHEIEVSQWVWIPQRPTGLRARALGGKGANLARLAAIGQPVPPCYVVTTEAFCRTLADHGLDRRIARCLEGLSPDAGSELSANAELGVSGDITVRAPDNDLFSALERIERRGDEPAVQIVDPCEISRREQGSFRTQGLRALRRSPEDDYRWREGPHDPWAGARACGGDGVDDPDSP